MLYYLHLQSEVKMEAARSPKCWYPTTMLHGIRTQKTLTLTVYDDNDKNENNYH